MSSNYLRFTLLILIWSLQWGASEVIAPFYHTKNEKMVLSVNGKTYPIRGMTFSPKVTKETIDADMTVLKDLGVNTIRTWGTDEKSVIIFDAAQRHGIKVMAGIWMRHGRPGAEGDDSFNWISDKNGIQAQWDDAIDTVKRYKDHPAILFWGVGNEVFLNMATDQEKVSYAKFLGKLCKEIKKLAPQQLIASSCAWTIGVPYWEKYCPDIDVYGVNSYGPGVGALQDALRDLNVTKPYVLTEFGARGEWDAPKDNNGLKLEPTDQEKWDTHTIGWKEWIEGKDQCLGGFVFNYGDTEGYNHAEVWLNLKVQECYRPQYWATRKAFTGKNPPHDFPQISRFSTAKDIGWSQQWVDVVLKIEDKDTKRFDIEFYYNQRLDGATRQKRDAVVKLQSKGNLKDGFHVKIPNEKGLIKLYAFVKDDTDNLAIAFTSYVILGENESLDVGKAGKKSSLPFYIYKDNNDSNNHYGATGYMGSDLSKLSVKHDHASQVHSGSTCMAIEYKDNGGWYGLVWQDPFGDWGQEYGGYDLRGAKVLSFWAKAEQEGIKIKFGLGMFTRDKNPWFDTAFGDTGDLTLTTQWTAYQIDVSQLDLTRVKTGFYFFGGGIGKPYSFYLDEVKFQ